MSTQAAAPLREAATRVATGAARHPPAVVVSAGRMQKTVKVRMIKQTWNSKLRKYFQTQTTALVHDPTSAVRTGDIIRMATSRHSKHVKHIVAAIVSPFGESLDHRQGKVLSKEERQQIRDDKRQRKVERRAGRGVESAILEALKRSWNVPEDVLAARKTPVKGPQSQPRTRSVVSQVDKGIRAEETVDVAVDEASEAVGRMRLEEQSGKHVSQP